MGESLAVRTIAAVVGPARETRTFGEARPWWTVGVGWKIMTTVMNALFSRPVRMTALVVTPTLVLLLSWTRMEEASSTQATPAGDAVHVASPGQVSTSEGKLIGPW